MIANGTRLGPYEVTAQLGAGGMGEVYRARDARLDRTVAIKVLPAAISRDPRFRERFEREARAISSLSHPHICTLYDIGSQDGVDYLVMEFLEGESLAERLAKGPLPMEQVLRYGVQIAEALDKAHRAGIVHRDLKPGNVVLTKSGAKLLDFGLAKFTAAAPFTRSDPHDATAAMTSQKPLTEEGTIVGTFQYMAPEQVEGREADTRTDIFAFGVLLYEMTTGKRAFDAKTRASLIASILDRDPPPISTAAPMTPPALERVVKMCMAKDPDERWQSAHDVAAELRWIADGGVTGAPRRQRGRWREALAWTLAAISLAAGLLLTRTQETKRAGVIRTQIMPPEKMNFVYDGDYSGSLAISPDAQWMTFTASGADGKEHLLVRRTSELTARLIPFTEDASFPFWSPDSRSIAFFAAGKLKRIEISGGPATDVCNAPSGRSGSWNAQGDIIFEPHWRMPLHRVSARGGKSQPITRIDEAAQETTHRWATFLPDGRHFLYLAGSHLAEDNSDRNAVYLASLDSPGRKLLLHARSNVVYSAGHLIFVRDRFLLAQRFDPEKLELSGEPRAIAENVNYDHGYLRASFAAADDGTLVYQTSNADVRTTLHWVDRKTARLGEQLLVAGPVTEIALSPDATRAVISEGEPSDLFLVDLERGTRVRITSHRFNEAWPVWSPDGKTIAFASDRTVDDDIYLLNPQHANSERVLSRIPGTEERPLAWSPDGRVLLIARVDEQRLDGQSHGDIYVMPATGPGRPTAFADTPAYEWRAAFSPDGRWVAFTSNESGQREVYVAPYPGPGQKVQVSTNGGDGPRWTSDGRELLFGSGSSFWVSAVSTTPEFRAGPARVIEAFSGSQPWNARVLAGTIAPDGQRALIALREGDVPVSPIVMVQNWAEAGSR